MLNLKISTNQVMQTNSLGHYNIEWIRNQVSAQKIETNREISAPPKVMHFQTEDENGPNKMMAYAWIPLGHLSRIK